MNPRDFSYLEREEKMLRTVFWVECSHSQSYDLWAKWSKEARKLRDTEASLRLEKDCDEWHQIGTSKELHCGLRT